MHCEDSIIGRELSPAEDTDSLRRRMYARQTVYAKTWRGFFSEKENEEGAWYKSSWWEQDNNWLE